ncbi:MAG TPA: DNA polymerase I [Bacteroidota bacterium]|nr:DNA polymerase I [Bacteroidota bacterium]
MPAKSKKEKSTRERLFLLDGMALAYRAYFSFINRPLINSRGENTSAIFGFVNALMKILNEDEPEHIAVVFDTKEPTFRHIMYDQYKATREKMPEDMAGQIDKLKDVVRAFNVPVVELPGYEADDIMGTLARKAEREHIDTLLVTGDKDFMQLVSPRVRIYRPGKQGDQWEILDAKAVLEKFGVEPAHVIDVLALTGDKSDNVPGVYGVGDKSAIPLVQEFGTVENILAHLDQIPQKGLQQKLRDHSADALLSKKLVTIDVQVPIDVDLHHLTARPKDLPRLLQLFGELEFNSLRRKLAAESPATAVDETPQVLPADAATLASVPHDYDIITTEKELHALAGRLKKSGKFVFDTETTSTEPLLAELVGISFCIKPGEASYVPVLPSSPECSEPEDLFGEGEKKGRGKKPGRKAPASAKGDENGFPVKIIRSVLGPVFSDASIAKIGQNIKYDILVLSSHGIETNGIAFDTMVAHYILRPDAAHGMDAMAMEYLTYRPISYDDLTGTGKDRRDIREIDIASVAEYSSEDADVTFRLYEMLAEKLEREKLLKLCREIEFPLISVLASMEQAGVALDSAYLADLSKELERTLANLTSTIYELAGDKFNINSTQQLSRILFQELKLTTVRKTKTGYSTDVGVLEALRHEHPIIEQLLDYRQIQKLKSTYIDALPTLINPKTGRVHTSFNQTVAATGRLSSSNPNLQNIPIRTELGRNIRKAFIPGTERARILSADYSQIELRIMAHVSDDEGLKDAFRNHEDIHATTAAKVFGVDPREVSKDMRRKAKEVNFGIMYGIGPFGLANRLDISQVEAKEIISTYFARFPRVSEYIGDTILKARTDGYVCTLLNRRRYLPDINSRNFNLRGNAERQAINMPIQGTAADMIKIAMVRIQEAIREEKLKAIMLLQVHDELVFETDIREEKRSGDLISKQMVNALPLSVPVEVDIGIGKHWLEAH